jgi:hypothetical protein
MKRNIGLALAMGLALLIAGCASQGSSGGSGPGAGSGGTVGAAPANNPAAASTARNFNLAVKCPGVHWEKTHGWSNQQIMQQESLEEDDIPACEQWVQAQPKGYVPPPPPGTVAAKGSTAPAGGAPAPAPH